MSLIELNRIAYPIALVIAVSAAFVLPIVRGKLRTGAWPLSPVGGRRLADRVVSIGLFVCGCFFAGWAVLYAALGAGLLRVWSVPPWLVVFGWCLAATGFVVVVVGQRQMGVSWRLGAEPGGSELVTHGLFRVCRNPIYSGILLALAGLVAVSPSPYVISLTLLTAVLVAVEARLEERYLRRLHGAAYMTWARRVGRFVPLVGRLRDERGS